MDIKVTLSVESGWNKMYFEKGKPTQKDFVDTIGGDDYHIILPDDKRAELALASSDRKIEIESETKRLVSEMKDLVQWTR